MIPVIGDRVSFKSSEKRHYGTVTGYSIHVVWDDGSPSEYEPEEFDEGMIEVED